MIPVLIIDDDAGLRGFLKYAFEFEGYAVRVASDGKEGIAVAKEFEPVVAVVDIWMPRKEGLETIRVLRQMFKRTHIIAISGQPLLADVSLFKLARKAGANATLLKPFSYTQITTLVQELLHGKQSTATNGNHL